ncbi:MAG: HEAT repeat domain-containing protein [Chlamydiae bacterium]|nr:HEAT repeat domain-containing protein [Chlamydiota bacterium]
MPSKILLASLVLSSFSLLANSKDYRQISYLISTEQHEKALDAYLAIYEEKGRHDFQVLEHLGSTIIEKGAESQDPEDQMLSLYGMSICGSIAGNHLLYSFLKSPNAMVQAAALQLVSQMFDDESEKILLKALNSPFFMIRMEALFHLAARRSSKTFEQIQSIQSLVPRFFHPYFADFYALDRSECSLVELKKMVSDSREEMRISALLAILKYGMEDLRYVISPILSQTNPIELETVAFTLGIMKDMSSVENLKKLTDFPQTEVRLSALFALCKLGYSDYQSPIEALAKKRNLFAISILGQLNFGSQTLIALLQDEEVTVRLSATLSLLKQRNPVVMPYLLDLFDINRNTTCLLPVYSSGRTMSYWQLVPAKSITNPTAKKNCIAFTSMFLENLLPEALELGEKPFIQLSSALFAKRQDWLVPKIVRLLENLQSPLAIELLKEKSELLGAPLIRAYANLALFRIGQDTSSKEMLIKWLLSEKKTEMIRFRPMMEETLSIAQEEPSYQLTPEETSGFLIEALDALSQKRDEKNIIYLLTLMKDGHPKNRFTLAGLLLRSLR